MPKGSLDEHNRECFTLWLLTQSQTNSTRMPGHPDEHHDRSGKHGPRTPQDEKWLEAISSPDCQRTDAYLRKIVRMMQEWFPEAYDVLQACYLSSNSDVGLYEEWRRQIARLDVDDPKRLAARWALHFHEDAMSVAVYTMRRERRVIYWPSPDEAHNYGKRQDKKRRIARLAYHAALADGLDDTEAQKRALRESGGSRTAVHYWTRGRPNEGNEAEQLKEA